LKSEALFFKMTLYYGDSISIDCTALRWGGFLLFCVAENGVLLLRRIAPVKM
jgi:hypothetical protein